MYSWREFWILKTIICALGSYWRRQELFALGVDAGQEFSAVRVDESYAEAMTRPAGLEFSAEYRTFKRGSNCAYRLQLTHAFTADRCCWQPDHIGDVCAVSSWSTRCDTQRARHIHNWVTTSYPIEFTQPEYQKCKVERQTARCP